jgi:DNA invertase Pin-like site-specific DNA recombinase
MSARPPNPVRCAIYTRVSTDQGLEQDFNSLDAQRDASQAFIRSQVHAGWTLLRTHYDDGGYSGGSTDRPALQRLLEHVRARKVDVIVVYKVDRLTRSLADFAKLVELFDAHGVSFVSVTQQFNTTTSMGRLTLNVLLSFAQFEREVTSERIRDKIAASKRKGLWVGGMVPLGYATKDRKIMVVEEEAERVREIFASYLRLGSLDRLMTELRARGIVSRRQTRKSGRTVGGIPFTRGPLSYLLRNRFYIGEVVYKGEVLPGAQPPIVDRDVFEAVQARLAEHHNSQTRARAKSEALLIGKLFDDRGHRMSPSHARKNGVRYRYYVSLPLLQGQKHQAGSIHRVPAVEVEAIVSEAVRRELAVATGHDVRDLVRAHVGRVEVQRERLVIELNAPSTGNEPIADAGGAEEAGDGGAGPAAEDTRKVLHVPWTKPPTKRRREIIVPSGATDHRPIRAEARARLVAAIAQGRHWLDQIVTGVTTIEALAARERCSLRKVNMTISLAFLAPDLVKAAVEGLLPRGMGIARLCDPPAEWSAQYQALGLTSP